MQGMTKSEKNIFLTRLSIIQNTINYIQWEKQQDRIEKAREKARRKK